ncbi:MAG TPA: LamG-like jellyroll fold domain-containing protein, partial [Trichococcus sp.]|nr:LamG-like jellyroll fold domain-containing protein [Trichococcus sp.]
TIFLDSSLSTHTITGIGGIAHSTDQHITGHTSAIEFIVDQSLSVPSSTDWDFGSGDYTLKAKIYLTSVGTNQVVFLRLLRTNDNRCFSVYVLSDGTVSFSTYLDGTVGNYTEIISSNTVSSGYWFDLVAGRNGSTMTLTVNGVTTTTTAANVHTPTQAVELLIGDFEGDDLHGYLDEIKILKGIYQA